MNDKTDGIVLKQIDYRDQDALLTVLCREYGRLGMLAKGIRKEKSKNRYACEPLTLACFLFDYKEAGGLQVLHSATIIDSFRHCREDLNKIAAANVMTDLISSITQENDPDVAFNGELFELLKDCLTYLDQSSHSDVCLGVFLARIAELMGIGAQVDACCICGNRKVVEISVEDGGFLCAQCAKNAAHFDLDFLRKFRLLNKASPRNFEVLEQFEPYDFKLLEILYRFLEEYGDIRLDSWTFLKNIRGL